MVSAIILAAGESKRMGQPKLLLPWGRTTVLGSVIETLKSAGLTEILIVTGGAKAEVEQIAATHNAQTTHNARKGEMLESIQNGLRAQHDADAVLIALGDQPQIEEETARKIIAAWNESGAGIIAPSYEHRRGHPWLIAKEHWDEILNLSEGATMRDFFKHHQEKILYINVPTESILQDLDTPEDYLKFKP